MGLNNFRQDRNEEKNMTWWGSGYGFRRSFVQITFEEGAKDYWLVTIYKGRGHFEDAKRLPEKKFKTRREAISFAKSWMRKNK